MKPLFHTIAFILFITSQSCTSSAVNANTNLKPVNHKTWNELLKAHVAANGEVDYKGFKKDKAKLDSYLKQLSQANVSGLSKNEQLAYWINAYNAFTVDLVVQNYPVKSIKDIHNGKSLVTKVLGDNQVWVEKLRYSFNGEELSLYNIENKKLLKDLFDPRIHFVINCASYSCPRLWNQAYTPGNVQNAMDMMAKDFINDKTKNKITPAQPRVSEIFNWYKSDFTKNGGTVVDYLNRYSTVKINANAKLSYIPYNWNLNE